jgi:hypothetical protein
MLAAQGGTERVSDAELAEIVRDILADRQSRPGA